MKVGDSLVIKLSSSEQLYRCKVIDVNNSHFVADHPINIHTNKSIVLPIGERITITFIKDATIYEYESKIEQYVKGTVPGMLIRSPEPRELRKIQRREFVRVQTNVDIAVHCPENSFAPFTTVTGDISGGGALLYLPPLVNVTFEPRQLIEVYVVLRYDEQPYKYIMTEAEVVQQREINDVKTFSIKFLFDNERLREQVISYCFEVQRKRRQEERL